MKVTTLLVTFNRCNLLKKSLDCLFDQTMPFDDLVIVDNNSTDDTFAFIIDKFNLKENNVKFNVSHCECDIFIASIGITNIHYIKLKKNIGGSGGFHSGVKYIRDNIVTDWIWGMDDDAFAAPKALESLCHAIVNNIDVRVFWSNCDNDNQFETNYKEVDHWMFVGFMIALDVVNDVGLPVGDYFIYHDDSEYSNRIIRRGYKIVKVRDSIIEHRNVPIEYWERNLFFLNIKFPAMPEWKLYYYMRNRIFKYKYSLPKCTLAVCKSSIDCLLILIVKPKFFRVCLKAIYHGVFNVKNKGLKP